MTKKKFLGYTCFFLIICTAMRKEMDIQNWIRFLNMKFCCPNFKEPLERKKLIKFGVGKTEITR